MPPPIATRRPAACGCRAPDRPTLHLALRPRALGERASPAPPPAPSAGHRPTAPSHARRVPPLLQRPRAAAPVPATAPAETLSIHRATAGVRLPW